ncbi:MAG: UrcA family protein [Sphingopyxis sp.]|uniref:UrcA family protein n=1 Tax=Sphingopyxis sp. TaxID=1908224 RepID=UPI002AB8ACA7|nr:UrcA family protein [Sphingopyxis sp.]MDZ3833393.1 UrcA family protein [Sphingopyxis sp.]
MKTLLILAMLAATVPGQPALAQDVATPAPAANVVIVTHSDLDLRNQRDARTLDRRIWRAVVDVCGATSDFDLKGKNAIRECRRDTRAIAAAQADLAIADATRERAIQVSSVQK